MMKSKPQASKKDRGVKADEKNSLYPHQQAITKGRPQASKEDQEVKKANKKNIPNPQEDTAKRFFTFPRYDPKYEFLLIGIGLIVGALAVVFLLQRGAALCEVNLGPLKFNLPCSSEPHPLTCADYGIKITSPQSGTKVWQTFNVQGTYVNEPPADSILLMLKAPAGDYFLQRMVMIDRAQRTWQGEVVLGNDSGKNFTIVVSRIGNDGRALFDYYTKVGNATKSWPAVETLTEDMLVCDRVDVVNEQP